MQEGEKFKKQANLINNHCFMNITLLKSKGFLDN